MCVKAWQATNYILTQAGAKRALVLACEVGAEAAGGGRCWSQTRAGEQDSQQGKQTMYLKMYQNISKS